MCLDDKPYGFGVLGLTIGPALVVIGLLIPFGSILLGNRNAEKKTDKTRFDKINYGVGWLVFTLSLGVYFFTLEPTASFWDCGEFIAAAYKLQVPHAPGAPLFLLLGRMFSLLALGEVAKVAFWINSISALASAFTVLFLFWTITILTRKAVLKLGTTPTNWQIFLIISSGVIGSFSFAFSDSFWFSAVEAEVYALSSFFTAFVVWAMLKWESSSSSAVGYRWLLLIAYMMGLSIGVHLLNLLAIPAMAFIYYYRHYSFTWRGATITFVISLLLIGVFMAGIITGLPTLAGAFELFFVNSIGLPFRSGLLIFGLLFVSLLLYGLRRAHQKQKPVGQLLLLSFIFILVGYSSYLIIPIRSNYNPLLDENNPEDIISFIAYLKREQYEQRPLFYGPQYATELIDQKQGKPEYVKGRNRYEVADYKIVPVYDPKGLQLLPRLYSKEPSHLNEYQKWVAIDKNNPPTFRQNILYLLRYQLGHMYGRYFLWNFVGRDSDIQHAGVNWPWKSNQPLPHRIATNKAQNAYYALPLLLGLLGFWYHYRRQRKDATMVGLLFLFTGAAIAFYLNQPPIEPRERDYAFVGSFYAFAIWIGLGVPALAQVFQRISKSLLVPVTVAVGLSLLVPILLFQQNWDDHDRSDRYFATDMAHNILSSCAPNAILFTNGDNDTFPLWYAQEVEGFRTDVRVIVLSYLNTDWYISQMKRPAYTSAPLPISLEKEQYQFSTNSYLPYVAQPQVAAGMDVTQFISLVKQNHPALQVQAQDGRMFLSFPTKKFFLPVNKAAVLPKGIVPANRKAQVVDQITWEISPNGMEKKQLIIFDILASNNWQRPVYFSSTLNQDDFMYFKPYLQNEGMTYRLLPALNPNPGPEPYVAKEIMYQNLMQKFRWRNLQNPRIFYDETYQATIVTNYRQQFYALAEAYFIAGDAVQARNIINRCLTVLPDQSLPYDYQTVQLAELLAKTGEKEKSEAIRDTITQRATQALQYYLTDNNSVFTREIQINLLTLQQLTVTAQNLNQKQKAAELENLFMTYYNRL
ncbi:DUF2723 domain-containing protein [Adhaeribacter arboris]|uniref:DUF2723 domain-containing protein n=2 Tax=Adhaeribacter arboris TaxID=2072846 RepID=A0A2T2YP95_9BACT|nr:DUF2723 domain-containing protein [Adhaeribacter arboris]